MSLVLPLQAAETFADSREVRWRLALPHHAAAPFHTPPSTVKLPLFVPVSLLCVRTLGVAEAGEAGVEDLVQLFLLIRCLDPSQAASLQT